MEMTKDIRECLITIIVPIYNVERFLRECLDSMVSQTDKNFKVILVNDGTKDSSGEIAKEYAKKFPELFKYIEQENKGLGGARNTGIDLVDTKYLRFFDSDDFMAPRTMETLNKELEGEDVDFLIFNPVIFDMVTNSYQIWYDDIYLHKILKNRTYFNPSKMPVLHNIQANVCRLVWNTSFLTKNKFRFLEHVCWEDVPAHFYLFHLAEKAKFSEVQGAYYYRTNSGTSITASTGKNRLDMKRIFEEITPYFESKEWTASEKKYMLAFLSDYMLWSIRVIFDEYLPEFVDISYNFFKEIKLRYYLLMFFGTKISLKQKLMLFYLRSKRKHVILKDRDRISYRMKLMKKVLRILKGHA